MIRDRAARLALVLILVRLSRQGITNKKTSASKCLAKGIPRPKVLRVTALVTALVPALAMVAEVFGGMNQFQIGRQFRCLALA